MKFSFSTLACPDYTWADIYSMAKDLGFDGIEVRGLGNDIFDASKNMPFSPRLLPHFLLRELCAVGADILRGRMCWLLCIPFKS